MAKGSSVLDLPLSSRPRGRTISRWLYEGLRAAILDGRLRRGLRLPATRDLPRQYGVARGTVVTVFEQLRSEGYLTSRVGSGTRVSDQLPDDLWSGTRPRVTPRRRSSPTPLPVLNSPRPFRFFELALDAFPIEL